MSGRVKVGRETRIWARLLTWTMFNLNVLPKKGRKTGREGWKGQHERQSLSPIEKPQPFFASHIGWAGCSCRRQFTSTIHTNLSDSIATFSYYDLPSSSDALCPSSAAINLLPSSAVTLLRKSYSEATFIPCKFGEPLIVSW